jgi:hypothetical protein
VGLEKFRGMRERDKKNLYAWERGKCRSTEFCASENEGI